MQLILATQNTHKVKEVREIAPGHEVFLPSDFDIDFEFEEQGATFLENSCGKAEALYNHLVARGITGPGSPRGVRGSSRAGDQEPIVIADDSGLCVDALGGAPGVLTARFGSPDGVTKLSAPERNDYLLNKIAGESNRAAYYVCTITAILGPDRFLVVQETWEGEIAREASSGTGGFGYDPVFYLPELGCTAADITAEQKHALSHRGKALQKVIETLSS